MISSIESLHQQAQKLLAQGQFQQAHQALLAILQQDKYFADGYFLLAMIASAHHHHRKCIALLNQAVALSADNAEYLAQLAKHYALENDHVNAANYAELAGNANPKTALTFDTIGVAYSQIGLHQLAVPFFQQAVAKNANNPTYFFNLGASLKFIGDFNGARQAYQQTLALAPWYCKAHAALTSLGGINENNNRIALLTQVFEQVTHADDRLYIGHALAREYEALKKYPQAFHYLSAAKKQKLALLGYDITQDQAMFTSLQQLFSQQHNEMSQGCDSEEPLFVVGMPRTGTTLVERILSQHSDVTSAGELQHFGLLLKQMANTASNRVIDAETVQAATAIDFARLGQAYLDSTRAITGNTAKFVDKMPLNVLYVGFMLQAFPRAKIVCLDRHPLDTIVSNFRQLFAINFSYYNYAFDLHSTAEFYLLFKNLVALWLKKFPDNFYVVNYETLVNNPEVEARKLVAFCGLSWQEQCLHIHENTAPVATASAVQVRQPISNKSVGNWRHYDAYLDEVKQLLANAPHGIS